MNTGKADSEAAGRLDTSFVLLWCVQLVNLLGDAIFPMVLVALVLDDANVALNITAIVAGRFVAMGALIIVGGVIADRFSKLRLIIAGDLFQAAFVAALLAVLLFSAGDPPLWLLVACSVAVGAGEALFKPTLDALIPEMVPPASLQRANGLVGVVRSLSRSGGPLLGAGVVALIGVRSALLFDLATFGVSIAGVLLLSRRWRPPTSHSANEISKQRLSIVHEAAKGFRVVWQLRWLRNLELMAGFHTVVAVGPWMVLLPIVLSGGATDQLLGYGGVFSAFFAGGVAGAAGAARFTFARPGIVALAGISIFGVLLLVIAASAPTIIIVAVAALAGFGSQLFDVIKVTAIQRDVPPALIGRIMSVDFFASFALLPVGQVLGGVLTLSPSVSPTAILAVGGVLVLVTTAALAATSTGIRQLRNLSDATTTPD